MCAIRMLSMQVLEITIEMKESYNLEFRAL